MVDAVVGSLAVDQSEPQTTYPIDSVDTSFKVPLPWNADTAQAMAARAAKAAMGVSNKTNLKETDIHDAIFSGKEDEVRQDASAQIDMAKVNNARDFVSSVTDPQQIAEMFKPTDPASVFEKHYAQEYVDHLDWVKNPDKTAQGNYLYSSVYNEPEYNLTKKWNSNYLAFSELLGTIKENGEASIGGTDALASVIADAATLGLYSEVRMRQGGLLDKGLLLGTNIDAQSWRLYSLAQTDFEAAKQETLDTYNYLAKTDKLLANRWINGIIGQSQNERFMNNLFTVLNTGGVALGGLKPLRKDLFAAVADMSKLPSSKLIPPRVSAPAAAGNIPESAVQKVLIAKINEFSGQSDPVKELKDRLSSNYDVDKTTALSDPTNLTKDMANRVHDVIEAGKDKFFNTVLNAARVNKTPATVTMESRIRQVQKALADENRGVDNQVLDVSRPIYVEGLNVHAHNVAIGTHDGDMFGSIEEARANAKLNGLIVKGDLIETPQNLKKQQQLIAALKGLETSASRAATPEGAARANASAEIIRQRLRDLPRHAEGVTIEHQEPTFNQYMDALDTPVEYPYGMKSKSMVLGEREPPATRIYRGEGGTAHGLKGQPAQAGSPATGNWFTTSLKKAQRYSGNGDVLYTDVTRDEMKHFAQGAGGKDELVTTNPMFRNRALTLKSGETEPPLKGAIGAALKFEPNEQTAQIVKQGAGFYINKVVYLDPSKDFVKDGLITTKLNTVREFRKALASGEVSTSVPLLTSWRTGWINGIMGRARNPAERLSIEENRQRMIATYGPSVLLGMLKDGNPVRMIPKSEWEPFNRMLKYLQKAFNEETKTPGIWFDHPSEIDNWYQTNFKRSPHPDVIPAYFAYKTRLIDDLNLRDLVVGQRKREMGFAQHNFKYTDINGNDAETGFFEGVKVREIPHDAHMMMIVGDNKQNTKVFRSWTLKSRPKLEEDVRAGRAKIIQVADPKKRPMSDLSGRRIEYVLAYGEKHQEKPVSIGGHVNRMGGGHLMPEYPWYFKQAKVDEGVYEGDSTIMNFLTRAQAEEALPHMENVRQHFLKYSLSAEGRATAADRASIEAMENEGGLIPQDHLQAAADANKVTGIPFHKHYDWYFGKNKYLSLTEPIHIVPQDGKIISMPVEGEALKQRHLRQEVQPDGSINEVHLRDGTKGEGSLLGKAMVEFTQERDAQGIWTMNNKGTQQNPIFAYEPAPYVDPITSMERGFSRIARTAYMSDMQEYSMSHWLEEAAPYLETGTANTNIQQDVRDNPLKHFNTPKYKDGTPTAIRWQLEANRKQAQDFIGRPSWVDNGLREIGQRLADSVYKATGGKDRVSIALMSQLPKMRNPIGFVRNMVFNPVLGMFSLPSFFTQVSTYSNVLAISPRQAPAAAIATLLYGWSKMNRTPEIMAHLDHLATQMAIPGLTAFKSGQFSEAISLLESTGFQMTGNEHAFASNVFSNRIITRGSLKFLDWGRLPFNLGSGFTKVGGFFTAYLEHRIKDPFGVIGRNEQAAILQRAGLLDHNMSSAFSTKLHTGAMSIPMQFQAYDLRLSEMMTGKNLTPAEKARLFVTSSMLYGVGIGGGATLIGFPIANYVNKQMETKGGYVPGDSPITDFAMTGAPSVMLKYLTGLGDYSKGTLYNTSKWGNKGIEPLEKILGEDATVKDMIGGVAGNAFYNTLQNTYGMRNFLYHKAVGNTEDFPLTLEDVLDNFNEISTVRNTKRLFYALNNHKWITKNEGRIQDITKAEAIVQYITGLSPKGGSDVWIDQKAVKDANDEIRWHQNYYSKLLQRALIAEQNNDPDSARKYYRQAQTEMELYIPLEKHHETDKKAYEQFGQDQRDRMNYEMFKMDKDVDTYGKRQDNK